MDTPLDIIDDLNVAECGYGELQEERLEDIPLDIQYEIESLEVNR